jgi:hypothetical protein
MPAGCDFICKNEDCKYTNSGFVILAPWPLAKIEIVINSSSVNRLPELKEKLIQQKNNGTKFACIQFPNYDLVSASAYRLSFWSEEGKCIWQYDVELNGKTIDEIMSGNDIPKKCEKTNCDIIGFNEILKSGINCPHCGKKMQQNRWYANE